MKILIIRFSSIGDIVLTTPVIRCLKKQLDVELHYLTKVVYKEVLAYNPFVDQLITIEKEIDEVMATLKAENYDLVIDLHHNLRTRRLQWALGKDQKRFRKLNWQKWMMVQFKKNYLPDVHIVDRYLETVLSLGVKNDDEGLDYFYSNQSSKIFAERNIPEKYVAIGVGAAHTTKRIPNEKIVAICEQVKQNVILIGGPAEAKEGEWIAAKFAKPKSPKERMVINTCGQTTIGETAVIIEKAQVVLTPDTGVMHIAAAFQRPIVVLWGNTIPEFGMYPYYKKGVNNYVSFEVKGLRCRPCSKIGFKECPKGHFNCMQSQDIGQVVEAIEQQIK